jgi:toxin ParE1/3/4
MSRRVIVRQEARLDLEKAALWYEEREAGLGWQLVLEVGAAIRRAGENPMLCLKLRHRPEVRRVLARRFPYRILFIVREDALVVFAIMHAARHGSHWIKRL